MKKRTAFLLSLLLTGISSIAFADVRPAALFSDHMVLQREKPIPVWGTSGAGERITVLLNNMKVSTRAGKNGRWMIKLRALPAGGPYNMEIRGKKDRILIRDLYIGEVWLCSGQSNMDMTVAKEDRYWCGVQNEKEEVAAADYPEIRIFDVDFTPDNDLQPDVKGKWEVCSPGTVGHFSAVAYFFAKNLCDRYNIPFGMITSAYGASTAESWISQEALNSNETFKPIVHSYQSKWEAFLKDSSALNKDFREKMRLYNGDLKAAQAAAGDVSAVKPPKAPRNPDPSQDQHNPYVCYNGMIAPLFPYALRGILWYQGESNGPTASVYRQLMETLVASWRKSLGQGDVPFFYVQLANYGKPMSKPVEDGPMMTVREAQLQNLSIPNTAMVVAIENAGDKPEDIHPKNKQEIGWRLALCAMNKVFGEDVEYQGPMYDHYQIEDRTIRLFFKPSKEDFVAWCQQLTGFAIAGTDKVFHSAKARLEGQTVVVWSDEVPAPVAVRYCWGTNPPASLANKDGLWAPNFRTDTENK